MRVVDREKLARLIAARGTIRDFARAVRCSEATVRHLVNGTRDTCSPDIARRICAELEVGDPSDIFVLRVTTSRSSRATGSAA